MATLLVSLGAPVNARDRDGATPLFCAVEMGDVAGVQLFLTHGAAADVDVGLYNGFTPLDYAAARNQRDMAALLLSYGANPNSVTRHQRAHAAVRVAARANAQQVAELLLAHGADPHARDKRGETAADRARLASHFALADELNRQGAKGK